MDWGPRLKTLQEIEATTGITPTALKDRPKVEHRHSRVLQDFYVLHRSRTYGFNGPNPLSLPDFAAYFSLFPEETEDEKAVLIRVWQALDGALLDRMYEKSSKESKT